MNPLITKFLQDFPEMTVIGFAWALFWRMYLVLLAVAFLAAFFLAILES